MTAPANTPIAQRIFLAMGTRVSVTLACSDGQRPEAAEAALNEIESLISDFGRNAWAWGSGALGAFNRELLAGRVATLPATLQSLFNRAWQLRERCGGLYEPRIGALVRLWGFADVEHPGSAPPAPARIAALLAALRAAPNYDGGATYGPAPDIAWDFGGIGKGHIVDLALARLHAAGFSDAMVDAGGNLAARGRRGERPWHVGIRDPHVPAESQLLLASLDINDETVNTHGDDQRGFDFQGRRYAHILDPRSGEPAQGLRALTVVHADGCRAEAEGAALFVAGAEHWPTLARQLGLDQVLAVASDGRIQATTALAARLLPQREIAIEIVD